jgi:hypothetical protein
LRCDALAESVYNSVTSRTYHAETFLNTPEHKQPEGNKRSWRGKTPAFTKQGDISMSTFEGVSESTVVPAADTIRGTSDGHAVRQTLDALALPSDPVEQGAQIEAYSRGLVTEGVLPEMLLMFDFKPGEEGGFTDNDEAQGGLMDKLAGTDDLISLKPEDGDLAVLNSVINNGYATIDGQEVTFSTSERITAAAVRDNLPALDAINGSPDLLIGVNDFNGTFGGDTRSFMDESLYNAGAFVTSFETEQGFVDVFGDTSATLAQVQTALADPSKLTEEQYRGLRFAEEYLTAMPENPVTGAPMTVDANTANMAMYDYGITDLSAERTRQAAVSAYSTDYETAKAKAEAGDDSANDEGSEESSTEAPEAAEDESDEADPSGGTAPAAAGGEPAPVVEQPEAETAEADTVDESPIIQPGSGDDPSADPEQLESGAFISRAEDGRPNTVYGVNGEEVSYEYEGDSLSSVGITDRDENTKNLTKTDGGWKMNGMSGSAAYSEEIDDVTVDERTGNITVTDEGEKTEYDFGLSTEEQTAQRQEETQKEQEAAAAVAAEELERKNKAVEKLEAELGRDVQVLENGDLMFELSDEDTLFPIRNAVAGMLSMPVITEEDGMQIYDDPLMLDIAAANGIPDIDVIYPGQKIVLSSDLLDTYLAA